MREAVAAAPVEPAAPPTREATIHDAIDALFAEKEKPATPAVAAPAEAPPAAAETEAETPTEEGEPAAEVVAEKPTPKLSASDYAIQLARAKKKLAAVKATAPAVTTPSADVIKRAAAIEAAGGNPLKIMAAAGVDLAAAVRAHENEQAENPEFHDPLAQEVKTLAKKLAQYEERERASTDAAATNSFFDTAKQMMAKAGDAYEFVAAHEAEGLELVKQLVLTAAEGDGETAPYVLPLAEALKLAEAHYSKEADIAAKTKKLAKKFQSQTRRPGIAQQASAAGVAPVTQTKPQSVSDVISTAIDALLG